MLTKLMNSLFLTLILTSMMMYFFSFHPIMIGSMVIFQAIILSSFISSKTFFSWFGFFIFIIYLGGILMLFSYIISLINSKSIIFSSNKVLISTFLISFSFNMFKEKKSFLEISSSKFTKLIMSMFSLSSMKLSIYLMIFLLLILIMVVYMTENSKGNMRKL
ncbi:NADH dehydrogenase subunit 6 (mitochondrion) [Thrips palmi]|uniref:NADH dehydrogenase subunit 6 n=1 Tax=Thrips palmi TaxID=161013 RepID=A0A386T9V3_THRPL|nr:NADH dehydrogenase subunit 6 [Thrips palmi]AYE84561.1 NADH dehydrogenase subunit 6 [Thrips palmi]UKT59913.1 NADH dehydrogenase subunit 6 [Thrips palmi]UKT59926.1 NADH dehydrogenase subunit 6 [Thrips palmi]UKT59939.1 NADH dehydrogenase subunit 6 [Thrips palmi]